MESQSSKENLSSELKVWPTLIRSAANALQNLSTDIPPTLILEPLSSSFENAKCLEMFRKVVIGRQISRIPSSNISNGFFSSRVLSRNHAEVWSEKNEVFIKDIKSSNGTYLNGTRLSAEGQESKSYRLAPNDVIEFGVDILDDSGEVQYQRISCKVHILKLENGSFKPKDLSTILRLCDAIVDKVPEEPTSEDNKYSNPQNVSTSSGPTSKSSEPPLDLEKNHSSSTIILQEEAKMIEQEQKDLEEISETVLNIVNFYKQEINRLSKKDNSNVSQLREDVLFHETQYRRLEETSANKEIALLEEIKELRQELHNQRQINTIIANEKSIILSLLSQHCSLPQSTLTSRDPLKTCPCQKELNEKLEKQAQYYENELKAVLNNNINLRERNDKYNDCLNSLSDKIVDISFNIDNSSNFNTPEVFSPALTQP